MSGLNLDFEQVKISGLIDTTVRAAVVGDTTILIVKDHTGEMSVCGFKTPLLVPHETGTVDLDADEKPLENLTYAEIHALLDARGVDYSDARNTAELHALVIKSEPGAVTSEPLPDPETMSKAELRDELVALGLAPKKLRLAQLRQLLATTRAIVAKAKARKA